MAIWHLGQFGTAHVGGTIWYRSVKEDNLAPQCKRGQIGTIMKKGQFGTTVYFRKCILANPAPGGRTDNYSIIFKLEILTLRLDYVAKLFVFPCGAKLSRCQIVLGAKLS